MATVAHAGPSGHYRGGESSGSQYGSGESRGSRSPLGLVKNMIGGSSSSEKKVKADGKEPKRRGPKPDSKPALTRRQELNRQAQRTHRERKEQYIKQMEAELMIIKEGYHNAMRDRDQAQAESKKLRDILEANGITYVLDMSSPDNVTATTPGNDPSSSGSFSGSYATPTSSTSGTQSPPPRRDHHHTHHHHHHDDRPSRVRSPNQKVNPSQAGIDFVLALEEPCKDHAQMLAVRAQGPGEEVGGHALMATCPPYSHIQDHPNEQYPHKMPDIPLYDLQKLFELSTRISHMKADAELTPIQAWAYITRDERFGTLSEVDFEDIKQELLRKVRCYGFGAVLEDFEVRDALEIVISRKMEY